MNVIEFKKQIGAFLETKCDRVYYRKASNKKTYPYITFNFVDSRELEDREDFDVEIDVWDKGNGSTAIETLVGEIDGDGDKLNASGLNRKRIYVEGKVAARLYRDRRQDIIDDDDRIQRRQLKYISHTYLLE